MLTLETSIQQLVKVELSSWRINDLVAGLPGLGREIVLKAAVDLIEQLQEQQFADLLAGRRRPLARAHNAATQSLTPRGFYRKVLCCDGEHALNPNQAAA